MIVMFCWVFVVIGISVCGILFVVSLVVNFLFV